MGKVLDLSEAERLINESRPSAAATLLRSLLMFGAVAAIVATTLGYPAVPLPPRLQAALPWLIVLAVVATGWLAARRQRWIHERVRRAGEAAEMGDWPRAAALAREALSRPIRPAATRAGALLILGSAVERAGEYDVGARIFQSIVDDAPHDTDLRRQAALGLVNTKLRGEYLTDAIRLLEPLRRSDLPPSMQAAVELVHLFQQVLMGHAADAVQDAERRIALFRRNLSTHAGYGYALLAAAFDRLGREENAARMWRDATLLIRPEALLARYDLLAPLARKYPASAWPI